jgi:hypothetical protein
MPGRDVTLVLCTAGGDLLGAAAPLTVPSDGDRDIEDVVAAAGRALRVGVRLLRILDLPAEFDVGGARAVAYLAEVDATPSVDLAPWPAATMAPDPKRHCYAEPGGHQRDLDWATATLNDQGIGLTAAAVQARTWSLSSIWRMPTSRGLVWLKVAPAFCASEAAVMPLLDERVVPTVLGAAPSRILLADVPGDDQYGASGEELRSMARMLIDLQAEWIDRLPELERLDVVDKRAAAALPRVYSVVDRNRHELDGYTQRELDLIVEWLPERFAALEACGIPDTLVHGDFYPGNVRGTPGSYRILDWGDCGVGNPMLDLRPAFERLSPADQLGWISIWAGEWSRVVPGCDARHAAELVRPLGPIFGAIAYQKFLDNIEPSERRYFDGDPVHALRKAVVRNVSAPAA